MDWSLGNLSEHKSIRVYKFLDAHFGMKTLSEKRLKISTLNDLNDPFELLPFQLNDQRLRKGLNAAREQWAAKTGLLCFSSDWRDPVIWAHYSDKHRGLCLGFEISENMGQRVNYISSRLPMPEHLSLDDAAAWVRTKYENWAYEKEIRCFASLSEASDGLYFMSFSESLKLVEVIVGARCTLRKSEIVEAIRPFYDVPILKGRPAFRGFEIVEDKRGFS